MSVFTTTPLLAAVVFGYQADPEQHAVLRRALGRRGGAEGFTAAATLGGNAVPHGVRRGVGGGRKRPAHGEDDPANACVPLTQRHATRLVDRLVLVGTPDTAAWATAQSLKQCRTVTVAHGSSAELQSILDGLATLVMRGTVRFLTIAERGGWFSSPRITTPAACVVKDDFLASRNTLQTVDLSGFAAVTSIGNGFLRYCDNLRSVNLSGLTNVTHIGDECLNFCRNLESVDCSRLTALTSVGHGFLAVCRGLQSVNLSGLTRVATVATGFLTACRGIRHVDLSPMIAVTSFGDGCLADCTSLESVNLSGLTAVTSIRTGFLGFCPSLTDVDLFGLSSLTSVGFGLLKGSDTLRLIAPEARAALPEAIRVQLAMSDGVW